MRVGFLTARDPRDPKAWSGTLYRMFEALRAEGHEVVALGPVPRPRWLRRALSAVDMLHRRLFSGRHDPHHSRWASRFYAARFRARLVKEEVDVLFAPAASTEIAHLRTRTPVVYLSDTSFAQFAASHPSLADLSPRSFREGDRIERRALKGAAHCLYPTAWASRFVERHYGVEKDRITLAPFGPNLDTIPERDSLPTFTATEPHRLLFLGVDWEGKGGPIAFEAFRRLRDGGYDVHLTVCGCTPPVTHPQLRIIPFLDKRRDEHRREFDRLFRESDLLLVPTRSECFGVVFCEAAAYGVPTVATDVGGVPEVVIDGETGVLLERQAGAAEYADAIRRLLEDPERMARMGRAARDRHERTLNWTIWARRTTEVLSRVARKED